MELKKKGILIVDDDENFRRFLKDHLSGKPGLEIVGEAEDGRKALEQAEALNPDLVLMDSRMPKLNGFKASRLLLEKMPHLRVIMLGVFNHLKDKQAAKECGACGYVQKLNVLENLLPAIRAAFRKNGDQKKAKKNKTGGTRKILRKGVRPKQRDLGTEQAYSAFRDRELFLAGILDSIQDGISVLDLDFTILQVNRTMKDWYAHAQPLAGKKCYEAYHLRKTGCDICPTRKTLLTSKAAFEVVPKVGSGGKGVGWLGLYSFPFMDQASGRMKGVIEYVRDITEQKRAEEQIRLEEARLQSLYNISQYKPKDMRDLWDYTLQEAISLTGSKVGWLGAYRADRQTLNVITWSREIMTDSRIKDRPTEFPIEKGGIWAAAIRSGEPLIINDYKADDPRKKGTPPGHFDLIRLLAMPILSEDKTVYLVVAANKDKDYDATDIRQLTLLMDSVLKITERKKAEEALRESEETYRALVENLNEAIFSTDLEGRLTYISPVIERFTHFQAVELIGRHFAQFVHPDDLSGLQERFRGVLQGAIKSYEYRLIDKGGGIIHVRSHSRPIYQDGRPIGITGLLEDISERKRAEEQIRYQADLLANVTDAVISTDLQYNIRYWNAAAEVQYSWAAEEVLGRPMRDFIQNEYPQDSREMIVQQVLDKGFWKGEVTQNRRDGTRFPVLSTVSLVRDSQGQPVGHIAVNRDITERKKAEEALRESEERFRTLFENSTIGIYRTTPQGRILLANPTLVRMLGYASFEELERRNLESEGFAPEFPRSRFHLMIEKEGEVRGLESAWKRADDKVIYIRESAKAIRDAGGLVLYYEGTVEDITERRRAEEALRLSGEQYQNLVESLNEVMISVNLEGKFDYVSPAVERITKYKVSELMGQPFARYVHPDDLPDLTYRFSQGMKGETRPYVFRILDKDGETKFIRTHSRPIMKEGKPVGLTGLLEDVTKRKRAEEALVKSEERFKLLFTFAPDAYTLSDLQGRFIDCNNATEVMSGYAKEKLIGKSFTELNLFSAPQSSIAADLLEKSAQNLPTGPDELILTRKDGQQVHLEIRTFPLTIGGEVQILGVARDITERKALENEAEKRMTELEEFYKMAVNRELRMVELKSEIEKLTAELARLKGGLEKQV